MTVYCCLVVKRQTNSALRSDRKHQKLLKSTNSCCLDYLRGKFPHVKWRHPHFRFIRIHADVYSWTSRCNRLKATWKALNLAPGLATSMFFSHLLGGVLGGTSTEVLSPVFTHGHSYKDCPHHTAQWLIKWILALINQSPNLMNTKHQRWGYLIVRRSTAGEIGGFIAVPRGPLCPRLQRQEREMGEERKIGREMEMEIEILQCVGPLFSTANQHEPVSDIRGQSPSVPSVPIPLSPSHHFLQMSNAKSCRQKITPTLMS